MPATLSGTAETPGSTVGRTVATARALHRDPAGWRTVEPAAGHDGDEGTIDFVVP